jgi:type II secretory pathway pseudopilin PulG
MEMVVVVGIIGAVSAIAAPMFNNAIKSFRLSGDARSVSNATAVAKMRAASDFSRVRLYVDLTAKTYKMQVFDKTSIVPPLCCWVTQGGTTALSSGVSFGYGAVTTPPADTQDTIGQAPLCTDDASPPVAIPNTACIMFNSRGTPIKDNFEPQGEDAIYVTDGTAVYGVTIASTGLLRLWRTPPVATPSWVRN